MEPLRAGDPRQVGSYRLTGRLGSGGMGQVFLGRSPGGRPVAVKVLPPELADDAGFRRRFATEVAAARRVRGVHTARMVDADPDADPPWLVTAYIPGPSLLDAVRAYGPLPPAAVGVLGAGLAEGLAAIHDRGLVHRDLKPGNVILAADGPRVIDFGIARALDATSLTASGPVVGTPSFMSPEQVRGVQVGPASDVFALGAVLVFAATGRGPFGTGPAEAIVYRIMLDDPDLTGLSPDLADLVGACLAKTPEDRPSLADLLDRLTAPDEGATRWLPSGVTGMVTRFEQELSGPARASTPATVAPGRTVRPEHVEAPHRPERAVTGAGDGGISGEARLRGVLNLFERLRERPPSWRHERLRPLLFLLGPASATSPVAEMFERHCEDEGAPVAYIGARTQSVDLAGTLREVKHELSRRSSHPRGEPPLRFPLLEMALWLRDLREIRLAGDRRLPPDATAAEREDHRLTNPPDGDDEKSRRRELNEVIRRRGRAAGVLGSLERILPIGVALVALINVSPAAGIDRAAAVLAATVGLLFVTVQILTRIRGRYGWFHRQRYLSGNATDFLGFALKVFDPPAEPDDHAEQLDLLLMAAFLEDLRRGYRRDHRRAAWARVSYPVVIFDHLLPGHPGVTFVETAERVRAEIQGARGRPDFDPLVIVAGVDPRSPADSASAGVPRLVDRLSEAIRVDLPSGEAEDVAGAGGLWDRYRRDQQRAEALGVRRELRVDLTADSGDDLPRVQPARPRPRLAHPALPWIVMGAAVFATVFWAVRAGVDVRRIGIAPLAAAALVALLMIVGKRLHRVVAGLRARAAMRRINGRVRRLLRQGRYEAAERASRAIPRMNDGHALTARANRAVALRELGRLTEAEQVLTDAVAESAGHAPVDRARLLRLRGGLEAVRHERGDTDAARRLRALLIEAADALGRDAPATLVIRANLAVALRDSGDLADVEEVARQAVDAVEAARRTLGPRSPTALAFQVNLAAIERDRGRIEHAERLLQDALQKMRRALGREHPRTLVAQASLAAVLHELGRTGDAIAQLAEVAGARAHRLGPDHPATLQARTNLGFLHLEDGDQAAAAEHFEAVVARGHREEAKGRSLVDRASTGLAMAQGRDQ